MTEKSSSASLNTVIKDQVNARLQDLHTCTPGKIVDFDPTTGRASIQPTIQRILVNGEIKSLPKLINCPVGNLKAGGFNFTLPVKVNDECMIHFTERSIDAWIKFGDIRPPNDFRLHAVTDAYFIPISSSEPNATVNYDPDNMVLRNDANTLKLVFNTAGDLIIDAVAKVEMTVPLVKINGNLEVTGTSTATDHLSSGKSGASHTHTQGADSDGNTQVPTNAPT